MKRYYRDFYGCTASVDVHSTGTATLRVCSGGKRAKKRDYASYEGARAAMRRLSEGWVELTA